MIEQILDVIRDPGPDFRGVPFWGWNAKLEESELRRQIGLMKEMKVGGFFMHARVGLGTPYLQKEWFDCVRTCLDEAKKKDLKAWLYDEDRWPSGAAGGLVTKEKRFRGSEILFKVYDSIPEKLEDATGKIDDAAFDNMQLQQTEKDRLIAAFAAVPGAGEAELENYRKFDPEKDSLRPGEKLIYVFRHPLGESPWFNGQAALDHMNPEAVRKFIEITHESYRREISDSFGTLVPGIFTDEPEAGSSFRGITVWTDGIVTESRKRFGVEIMDHLPELFFRVGGNEFSRIRWIYRECCTALFSGSYARQIGEWCEKNHLAFTGHILCEDTPVLQTFHVGDAMRFYQYQQAPGIDVLTDAWNLYAAAKQCTSVAHQFGRERRLTELYGCTGWQFPFAGHKALGDWQFALGINLRVPHLAWYSMAAEAKRDFPASIFYQSPWFRSYSVVEDYFARLNAALSEGEEQRDLLLIHPIESYWGTLIARECEDQRNAQCEVELEKLSNLLLSEKLDYDFGCEALLDEYGSAENGKLRMNKALYKGVLIPELRTIRRSTLELLKNFREQGGHVWYLGNPPSRMDAQLSAEPEKIYAAFEAVTRETLSEKLSPLVRRFSVTSPDGKSIAPVLALLRKAEDHQVLFVCNTGTEFRDHPYQYPPVRERKLAFPEAEIRVTSTPSERVYELDLMTGEVSPVVSRFDHTFRSFRTAFAELGTHLFFLTEKTLPCTAKAETTPLSGRELRLPEKKWKLQTDDYNVLVLDRADCTIDGKFFAREAYILNLDDRIRKEVLHVQPRGGAMVQPWLHASHPEPEVVADLSLEYRFSCGVIPERETFLGIERPELYEIIFNGKIVEQKDCGYWCDRSMRRILLTPEHFRIGRNSIVLKGKYHRYLPGLETVYLLGNFAVAGDTLLAMPETLDLGDWCAQGLPNYSGNVEYTMDFSCPPECVGKRMIVEFGQWQGAALSVNVNGIREIFLPWLPMRTEIGAFLREGKNLLTVKVYGHRRNSHGPFFIKPEQAGWTGPGQYKSYESPTRFLVVCGLLEPPRLCW